MKIATILPASILAAGLALPAGAEDGFAPGDNCQAVLAGASPTTKVMLASWMIGHVDSSAHMSRAVNTQEVEKLLSALAAYCAAFPQASLADVVREAARGFDVGSDDRQGAAPEPGSESSARALLSRFLEPGADRVALTRPLIASAEDIRAVYKEPLASRMIEVYRDKLPPNIAITPKPGQSELLIWWATTDDLIAGAPVAGHFPGGYKRAAEYMNPGFPIVRFKFVKPGETAGMAYDGLIWVNGHWAWMPKPWRMIE